MEYHFPVSLLSLSLSCLPISRSKPLQFIIAYFLFSIECFILSSCLRFSSGNSSDIQAVTVDESILFSCLLINPVFFAGKCPAGCLKQRFLCWLPSALPLRHSPLRSSLRRFSPCCPVRLQTGCYTIRHRSRPFQAALHGGPVPLFSHLSSPGLHPPPDCGKPVRHNKALVLPSHQAGKGFPGFLHFRPRITGRGSSRMSMGGRHSMTLVMHKSCFCPWERLPHPSEITVS